MFYFRAIPKVSVLLRMIFLVFANPISKLNIDLPNIKLDRNGILLFRKSRDGMNFLFEHFYKKNGRQLQVWLPSLYCWEIVNEFNNEMILVNWYPVNSDFQPDWDYLNSLNEKFTFDVFYLVSFFGVPAELSNGRNFAKKKKAFLFIDETHSAIPSTTPEKNEFLFLSWYKQFSIPNGAVVLIDSKCNDDLITAYSRLPTYKNVLSDLVWVFKTLVVKLTNRMPYLPNTYTTIIDSTNYRAYEVSKGMSFISEMILNISLHKIFNLKFTYQYYEFEINRLCSGMNYELINFREVNSHLFGIRFGTIIEANAAYEIFKKKKFPVVSWPQKQYITIVPTAMREEVKSTIDRMLFLCAFSDNFN